MRFDDFDTHITCEEFYDEWHEPDHGVDPEEEDHDVGDLPDDDEPVYADDIYRLFDENHGLTAEGYALLAKMDDMGDFL